MTTLNWVHLLQCQHNPRANWCISPSLVRINPPPHPVAVEIRLLHSQSITNNNFHLRSRVKPASSLVLLLRPKISPSCYIHIRPWCASPNAIYNCQLWKGGFSPTNRITLRASSRKPIPNGAATAQQLVPSTQFDSHVICCVLNLPQMLPPSS
jgi:hypothetical protein